MAKLLSAHLSYKSAIALIPPSRVAAPIETVRCVRDTQFARWPPHINLLYPFLASPSEASEEGTVRRLKQNIFTRVREVTKHIQPVNISLDIKSPGTFFHSRKSKTVFLNPTTQFIQKLQKALQIEFTECDADRRPFQPHLTVGQADSNDSATSLIQEIREAATKYVAEDDEKATLSLDWHIDRVFVIEREGYDDRFEVIGVIELGNTEGTQAASISSETGA